MQTAIAVAAALVLVGSFALAPADKPSLFSIASAAGPAPKYEVAGDGVDVALPSSQVPPGSTFGTPIAGASPMPSAKKFTHNMFEP
ncbi:hypothetical protein WJX74_008867 [Apatococcus lobatus]|uniref:Uncharacterized protein n=1 Tax=Apatococcus lobatus TaxID=904363 RepID=A0AAW1R039_9CHLO